MNRRNFLHQSGILLPAMMAVPSAIFATTTPASIDVVVVQGMSRHDKSLTAAVKTASRDGFTELYCKDIKKLAYSDRGFTIVTIDNKTISAKKVILNTFNKMDGPMNSINIKTVETSFNIKYKHANEGPEFWSFQSGKCSADRLQPFLKRKGNAFLCIS